MLHKLKDMRLWLAMVVSVALLAALACAAEEPTTPAVTKSDIQAAMDSAVAKAAAAAPAAPTGPSVAEMRSMVESAVAASAPAATDPADIRRMVETAVSGVSTGVSKAELEAAIASQAGNQMTASDVKRVVDSAIRALPAPQVDTSAIRPLIEQAVKASVPEATDPAQIRAMVEAAVAAATANVPSKADLAAATAGAVAGVPTRGELEASITKSIKDATEGALTAAQVQKIVDTSVDAMAASVEATARAAREAATAALKAGQQAAAATIRVRGLAAGAAASAGQTISIPWFDIPPPTTKELDEDQVFHWPIKRMKAAIVPWKEGAMRGKTYVQWAFSPPFHMKGNGELRAGFAVGYSVSEDSLTYTIQLDPAAIYQDGTPVTAASVKALYEWSSFPENQVAWGGSLRELRNIAGHPAVMSGEATETSGMVALDDNTLQITLATMDQIFPLRLSSWLLGMMKVPDVTADPEWDQHPIGVGPYMATWNPPIGSVELNATANWWRDPPRVPKAEIFPMSDYSIQHIMYENGETDFGTRLPQGVLEKDHPLHGELRASSGAGLYYLGFDTTKAPFDDPKVRAAINHAVDMESFVNAVYNPSAGGDAVWAAGILSPTLDCFDAPSFTGYEYDPAYARRLLSESKYGSAQNLPPIVTGQSQTTYLNILELMQEQLLTNLGVNINLVRFEAGQQPPEEFNLMWGSLGVSFLDPGDLLYGLGHSESQIVSDKTKHANPLLDALIETGNSLPLADPGRCKNFLNAEQEIVKNYYYVPVWAKMSGGSVLTQPWITNFEIRSSAFVHLPWMEILKRGRELYGK